ncbi:MAG: hypothetical protein NTY20_03020 [Candidatus Aenigmarchaeota archaeon]|nr:hypothetical protein [Candidatus Aenigmarchaeota archaeon]
MSFDLEKNLFSEDEDEIARRAVESKTEIPKGALPAPATPRGSSYQQTKKTEEKKPYYKGAFSTKIEGLYKTAVMKFKEYIYRLMTQGPILARDWSIQKINKLGKYFDIGSSIIEAGLYSGAVEITVDDYKNRLDMYFEEDKKTNKKIIRGFRLWTDRDPKAPYIQILRKEAIERGEDAVPRAGKPIKMEDLNFDDKGRITGFKPGSDVGGELLRLSRIGYDSRYYVDSHAEDVATAYLKEAGADLSRFRQNLLRSTIYYYLNHKGSANVTYLGESSTGNPVYSLVFPHSLEQIDWGLAAYTMFEVPVIYGLKKVAKWFKQIQALADMSHVAPSMEEEYGF